MKRYRVIIGLILLFVSCMFALTILDYLTCGVQNIKWKMNFHVSIISSLIVNSTIVLVKFWNYINN